MQKPRKLSLAIAIFRDGQLLVVLRPDDPGEELPGVWGLPAASQKGDETAEACIHRLAQDKLGLSVTIDALLARGHQERASYILDMKLYSATISGSPQLPPRLGSSFDVTYYVAWRWAAATVLSHAAEQGSLCAHLLLRRSSSGY